jgi:uncharacterized protein (UPF0332 family)
MRRISDYFQNEELLVDEISFHVSKGNLIEDKTATGLVLAHIEKAKHNLRASDLLLLNKDYGDWVVISLYYALYHSCLALVANKGYYSKNHTATLLVILKNYSNISHEEIEMIDETSFTKSDAEFYTSLKQDRHDASYTTSVLFDKEKIELLRKKTISFINKIEEMLEKR